jgi:hypothetical protein
LKSFTIPGSVTSLGSSAFFGCGALSVIIVDISNAAYSSNDGVLLNKNQTTLVTSPR